MATYAIGDIQGCYQQIRRLLKIIKFNDDKDKLLIAGDLVNRGPDSLKTLRFLKKHENCQVVLGNHDIHLLALYYGVAPANKSGTLNQVLKAKDADTLVEWLRNQPLVHYENKQHAVLVHAGIPPIWSLKDALKYSKEVEKDLKGNKIKQTLAQLYGNEPNCWRNTLRGGTRRRVICNYLTRMRYCSKKGALNFNEKGYIYPSPKHYKPWFKYDNPSLGNTRVLFGHWAALQGKTHSKQFVALDTGCVWGNELTAYCLQTKRFYHCAY